MKDEQIKHILRWTIIYTCLVWNEVYTERLDLELRSYDHMILQMCMDIISQGWLDCTFEL